MRVSSAAMAGEKVGSLGGVEEDDGGGGGENVDCSAAMRARAAERASEEGSGSMYGRDSWYAGGTAILSICFDFGGMIVW